MPKDEANRKEAMTLQKIKQTNEAGEEFWFARDLQDVLEYSSWERFSRVLAKAMRACEESGQQIEYHFHHVVKMVQIGSNAKRSVSDLALSRYACYLIVQNGDPSKPIIAHGQTYFAIQTRRQELADEKAFAELEEDEKRLLLRKELKEHNKLLVETAQQAGVKSHLDFAVFQNYGYKGLYGGLDGKGIHWVKQLKKSQKILDHMGSTELAANLFRATQTEEKLRREDIRGKGKANRTHFEVGSKIRKTIKELGGTMPEDLPAPERSIKQIESKQRTLADDTDGSGSEG